MSAEPARPLAVAVTGGAGSGKSLVCRRLSELGAYVQSADQLARQAVEPGSRAYEQIVRHFGEEILAQDGSIDRPKLRSIIIRDDDARKILEGFVHPGVMERITECIEEAWKKGALMAAVEVPLLFETGMQKSFDCVIMVSSEHEIRVRRIMDRDNATRGEAEALMKTQMPERQKLRLADYVVDNNGSLAGLYNKVDRIYEELKAG